ncbi:SRPBCC family protein [Carboxylicivirga sp. N1Y90]|uniref:SRPBCC family protein n=1 Tax=Carboxylicivirga fragile TaxID=3417571 RepID=UPI003D342DD9|nr:SRPBCC family protein [Marinilabiliaceae bacterium N1Y90]
MLYVIIAVSILILGVLIWLASIDGSYHVKRSITVKASKDKAFNLVADFNSWKSWSPWLCMEPEAEVNITNNGVNVGAINSWVGELVGSGEIEHLGIEDNSSIDQEIRFIKPFKSKSKVYWSFTDKDDGCEVTWGMQGKMPFLFKFMAKNMEPWIGMDYDRGLKMIKDLLEIGSVASNIKIDGKVEAPSESFIGIRTQAPMNDLAPSMQECFGKLKKLSQDKSITFDKTLSVYHDFDFTKPDCDYTAGIIAEPITLENNTEVYNGKLEKLKAIKVTFTGDYKHIGNAWSAAYAYARNKKIGIKKNQDPFEFYLTDPELEPDPNKWVSEIYLPIK